MVRAWMERLIGRMTRDGRRAFFDPRKFPWTSALEAEWRLIGRELDSLLARREAIPNFQDISEDQRVLTQGADWKTFFFYAYGHRIDANCARCPDTARALARIPGMTTAFFSILAPGKRIPEHRGPYKGVLRYHLGLRVPFPDLCGITVGSETAGWAEGKSLIFDDTLPHSAWNLSSTDRAILFVDVMRPLGPPLSWMNRLMIWHISRGPFVTGAVERIRRSERDAGAMLA